PKIDSAFDNLFVPQPSWSPSTTQQLRKLVAAPYLSPNDWTPRLDAYFASPLALCARRVSSVASQLLGSTSLRFALHGWQQMSILARDWAYRQALRAPEKPVLVALAEHVGGAGRECWPSLALMTGYSERTVRRALRALEAAGLVRIERRPGRPALYSLNLSTTPDRESGAPGQSVPRTGKNRK
ncbi:helix-turn-helix transcriptional regulator, partial [Thiolapillus sp.]|uniref:helix-turn-helix transcriptional regulator n=1 Tax=Thiolapillus sp. TaxID=2017437 RepID=UPI003AF60F3C